MPLPYLVALCLVGFGLAVGQQVTDPEERSSLPGLVLIAGDEFVGLRVVSARREEQRTRVVGRLQQTRDDNRARAFMHLDTVLTMADYGVFVKYAGLGMLPSYTIEPGGGPRELKVTDHPPEDMHDAIAGALGLGSIRVLTARQDVHSAQREQWDDGCNVLAVSPGLTQPPGRDLTPDRDLTPQRSATPDQRPSRLAAALSAVSITATDGLRTLDARATAYTSRAWGAPGSSRTATRRSPAAMVSRGSAAIPMPCATRLRIVDRPSNSHGAGGMPPVLASSLSTAWR